MYLYWYQSVMSNQPSAICYYATAVTVFQFSGNNTLSNSEKFQRRPLRLSSGGGGGIRRTPSLLFL